MKRLIKQLAYESVIYGLSGIITRLISVFLVPLYTRILLPEDYGVLNLINTTFYFVGIVMVFSLDNSAARWFYDYENDTDRKKPIASWFWFQLVLSVITCVGFISLSFPLSRLIIDKPLPLYFILPSVTLIFSILPTIIWNWLRLQRKPWLTITLSTGSMLMTILLNVLFVIVWKQGIKGILLALLISNVLYTVVAVFMMKDWLHPRHFSKEILKKMLRYALPLLPTSFACWVLNGAASFFIKHYQTMDQVGLYSIGLSISSAVGVVIGAFQMAWSPFAFSILNKPEAKRVYAAVLTLYAALASFVALGVALFAREILIVLTTANYYSAHVASGILAFSSIIYGFVYIGITGSSIAKKTTPLAIAILAGSVASLILYLVLTPAFGKEGAAISSLLGYMVIPVYVFYRSQQVWHIPYKFEPTFIIFSSAAAIFFLSIRMPLMAFWPSVFLKSLLLLGFVIIVLLTAFFYYREEVQTFLHKRNSKLHTVNE